MSSSRAITLSPKDGRQRRRVFLGLSKDLAHAHISLSHGDYADFSCSMTRSEFEEFVLAGVSLLAEADAVHAWEGSA